MSLATGTAFLGPLRSISSSTHAIQPVGSPPSVHTSASTAYVGEVLGSTFSNVLFVSGIGAIVAKCRQSRNAKRTSAKTNLQAFEDEIGVQAPTGYWDPLGLGLSGDAEEFRRRRRTELKHGRVAMWASVGYIVPEFYKWPGYLSPSSKLMFKDVPNGLAAMSKVPAAGWAQIIVFAGYMEGFVFKERDNQPGDFGMGLFGTATLFRIVPILPKWPGAGDGTLTPELKKRKLNSEIANGRLAMMAIIGMFYQDGLTGSAWGDWANYTNSPLR
jgi:hypothetical protein